MGLLKLFFIELRLRSSLFLGNALLDVDHFLLAQRAFAHGNQGDDPADERQTELRLSVIQKIALVQGSVG